MSYKVEYTSKARKDLKKLPLEIAQSIIKSINSIEDYPYLYVKKIEGTEKNPLYTHCVGEYRAILHIENEHLLILVIEAGHRKNIYRKFR
jgi:mRNA interferase RelE/StbE